MSRMVIPRLNHASNFNFFFSNVKKGLLVEQSFISNHFLSFNYNKSMGTPPPTPEWGLLIAEVRNYISTAWWLTTFPGIVVVLVVLSANRISHHYSGGRR